MSWAIFLFSFSGKTYNICGLYVFMLSCVQLFAALWTVALQAPLSMEFYRQEYWSWLPLPTPEDLLTPGIEPESLVHGQAGSLPLSQLGTPNNLCKEYIFQRYRWESEIVGKRNTTIS